MNIPASLPKRAFGRTGDQVTIFGLGGEGVLRSDGRGAEAAAVITRALDLGVNYCDTAPAYASSRDYYGATLGERRAQIYLASKTHDRTRDGSLRLLDDSLRRLRTDHLDLWQLHDLRTRDDLERIFSPGGALEALVLARSQGRVRHLGITGHHDPAILVEAMRRFPFDAVLLALNAADPHRLPFASTVLAEARQRGMAAIAMKVYAQGAILGKGGLSTQDAFAYAVSQPGVSLAIIGCSTPDEVEANAKLAREFKPLSTTEMQALEQWVKPIAARASSFKR